jgi:hypothetical protein
MMGKEYTNEDLDRWILEAVIDYEDKRGGYAGDDACNLMGGVLWDLCQPNEAADAAFAFLTSERTRRRVAAEQARRKAEREQPSEMGVPVGPVIWPKGEDDE